jgi:hypothetical protein
LIVIITFAVGEYNDGTECEDRDDVNCLSFIADRDNCLVNNNLKYKSLELFVGRRADDVCSN